ncbi:MAG TPA: hypothetical protein VN961_02610 [Streptosporangiaceae bacterium]|nr:hypothetical protein [Streptosporangiaceae bacterium]
MAFSGGAHHHGRLTNLGGSDDVTRGGRADHQGREVLVCGLPHIAAYQRRKCSRATTSRAIDSEDSPDRAAKAQPCR